MPPATLSAAPPPSLPITTLCHSYREFYWAIPIHYYFFPLSFFSKLGAVYSDAAALMLIWMEYSAGGFLVGSLLAYIRPEGVWEYSKRSFRFALLASLPP